MEISKDKEKLKKERADAKIMRTKIVGVGNTIDSYGDKFLSAPTEKNDRNYYEGKKFGNGEYKRANKDDEGFGNMGTYDQYQPSKTLNERIGNILEGVSKFEEKQAKNDNKNRKDSDKGKKEIPKPNNDLDDIDFFDFGDNKPVTKSEKKVNDNINFLDM